MIQHMHPPLPTLVYPTLMPKYQKKKKKERKKKTLPSG
jgi:hypothetical protein